MIFNKDAIFPYPILSQYSNDYEDCNFHIDLELISDESGYTFLFDIELTSTFVLEQIRTKKAKYVAVMSSMDNQVFDLEDNRITIPKKHAILSKKTSIQLYVVATVRISMGSNNDLSGFYDSSKKNIYLNKYTPLAISNVIKFDGEITKPFQLFKYSFSPSIESELSIEIDKASEFIEIKFKQEEYTFNTFGRAKNYLMYPYVYLALQKVLTQMILDFAEEEMTFNVDDITEPDDLLYRKIYNYLKIKNVDEVSFEKIDRVIDQISDSIVSKFTKTVGDLRNEN